MGIIIKCILDPITFEYVHVESRYTYCRKLQYTYACIIHNMFITHSLYSIMLMSPIFRRIIPFDWTETTYRRVEIMSLSLYFFVLDSLCLPIRVIVDETMTLTAAHSARVPVYLEPTLYFQNVYKLSGKCVSVHFSYYTSHLFESFGFNGYYYSHD